MKRTKVLFAYCHELERSISIDQARAEYFSQKPEKRKRFKFSCSDRNCGVLISGVNYHVMAEEGVKYQTAHFRSPYEHQPGCEWIKFTDAMESDQSEEVSGEECNERKARKKLKDHINHFTPWTESDGDLGTEHGESGLSIHSPGFLAQHREPRDKKDHHRWQRYTRTNQLQRLIDTWQDAKTNLSDDEFRLLKLYVEGYGQLPLYRYVTHIRYGLENRYKGVVYGGALLKKRYGRGFLLQFFDKNDGKTVNLYVSKELMNCGRFGHYVDEVLSTENVKYFQVFLLNPSSSDRENSQGNTIINLHISDLRQLVMFYELKTKTSAESESEESCGDNCAW